MKPLRWMMLLVVGPALTALARDIYVDPDHGQDTFNGLAQTVAASPAGPVKTIARGIALAKAGDTVHLANLNRPYHESILLNKRSGAPGKPLIIDGHGATLTGVEPLDPKAWVDLGDGLYRSDSLFATVRGDDAVLLRMFFIFKGQIQYMDRVSKGARAPFKKPGELAPGQWTYQAEGKAFYLRLAPGQALAEAGIEIPHRSNGVGISGSTNEHLIIRNLTCTRFINDGFNLHNSSRDVRFENIKAIDNGDDGLSAHETCEFEVDGFEARGNATGVCNIGRSRCKLNHLRLEGNRGYEFFALEETTFELRNSLILPTTAAHPVTIMGQAKSNQTTRVTMDNVQVIYRGDKPRQFEVLRNSILQATRLTTQGLTWNVTGEVTLDHSLLCGGNAVRLTCGTTAVWHGDNNLYDLGGFTYNGHTFPPADFANFQRATGHDVHSRCQTLAPHELPGGSAPKISDK
ncbi:MAG: right-handed parallel beta-helix repeat-containing protein [Verrucomicrobiota bacterium]